MVRCKFQCIGIEDIPGSTVKQVKMTAQYCPEVPEDERLTEATPWGELNIRIDNPAALKTLKAGKFYYLDLTPAS